MHWTVKSHRIGARGLGSPHCETQLGQGSRTRAADEQALFVPCSSERPRRPLGVPLRPKIGGVSNCTPLSPLCSLNSDHSSPPALLQILHCTYGYLRRSRIQKEATKNDDARPCHPSHATTVPSSPHSNSPKVHICLGSNTESTASQPTAPRYPAPHAPPPP